MKRSQTFDEYRRKHEAERLKLISEALKILSNAEYSNVTSFARDVAKLVTEFESSRNTSQGGAVAVPQKPMSHVTLLRNKTYRDLLERFLKIRKKNPDTTNLCISDDEALKFEIASLRKKNQWLEQKILAIDSGASFEGSGGEALQASIELLQNDLALVISIYEGMCGQVPGAFKLVPEGETTPNFATPGFHGPRGLIAPMEDMHELDRICDDVAKWRKRPKRLPEQ